MKRLAVILLCLTCLIAMADRRGQIMSQRSVAASWTDPSGSNTLFAWWNYADTTSGQRLGATNPWTDRVAGVLLRTVDDSNTALSTSTGVFFTVSQFLTNAPLSLPSSNHTVCIICAPDVTSTRLLWSPYDGGDVTQAVKKSGFFIDGGKFYWGTAFTGGAAISGTLTVPEIHDLIAVQNGGTITFYTNGVQSASLSKMPELTGYPWRYLAHDNVSSIATFHGVVKQVLVWSNVFSATQITNVHSYATNLYSYSP